MKYYSSLSHFKKGSLMFLFNLSPKSEGKMNLPKKTEYAENYSVLSSQHYSAKTKKGHLAPGVEAGEVTEGKGLPHQGLPNEGLPRQGVSDEGLGHHLGRPLAPHPPDRLPLPLIWRDSHPSTKTHITLPTEAKS